MPLDILIHIASAKGYVPRELTETEQAIEATWRRDPNLPIDILIRRWIVERNRAVNMDLTVGEINVLVDIVRDTAERCRRSRYSPFAALEEMYSTLAMYGLSRN